MPDYIGYQKSISNELKDIQDRVRYFIDDRHYGEDGLYKEVILREFIEEHLPAGFGVGTGFAKEKHRILDDIVVG